MDERVFSRVAKDLVASKHAVTMTGAGLSVASGIPTFRGEGGLWTKFNPEEYAHIETFKTDPEKHWEFQKYIMPTLLEAKPNPAHTGIARLEELGILKSVITQNVDGLHGMAGSKKIIEFHGNKRNLVCLECGKKYPAERSLEEFPPRCECGPILKPDVVLFGEQIPIDALIGARDEANNCDLMMVIGTSAMVFPASELPILAKSKKAIIVEINPEPTHLTGFVSDYFIDMESDKAVPRIVQEVEALVSDKG